MSSFYIVLQEKIPGVDATGLEGHALSKHNAKMEALARDARLTPLINFFSVSEDEVAGLFEDNKIPDEAVANAQERWFSAEEGLTSLEGMICLLPEQAWAEGPALEKELREFQHVLEAARSRNIRRHLAIDY